MKWSDEHTIESLPVRRGIDPEKAFSRRIKQLKQKLIYFLSDPSFSDKELDMLFDCLKADNIEEITTTVKKIRKLIENPSYRTIDSNYYNSNESNRPMEVEKLLIKDANLSREEAMDLLASRFDFVFLPNSHLAFKKWVEKLGERVGWSELLHAAHLIRNDRVHGKPDNPWPLEQND